MIRRRLPAPSLLLRLLVAATLLAIVFRVYADPGRTIEYLRRADRGYLIAAILVAIIGEMVTAWKLRLLFQSAGQMPPFSLVVRSCFIAMFYNNILPGSVGGDVVRVFVLARHAGGKAMAAAGVFMQRNTGFGGLLIVALLASWFPPYRLNRFNGGLAWADYAGLWFLAVACGYGAANAVIISEGLYRLLWHRSSARPDRPPLLHRFPSLAAAGQKIRRLHDAVRVFQSVWGRALLLSVLTQLVDCLLVLLAGRALGLELSFRFLCIAVPAVTLTALLPVSLNGIGLRELVYLFFFRQIGVDDNQAVAVSLLHYGIHLLLSLAGGFMHWRAIGSEARKDAEWAGKS